MIYFIRSGRRAKIGYAVDPHKRLRELQTGSAHELELLGYVPGNMIIEKRLHKHFEPYHLRAEWFCLSQEIKLFIKHRNIAPLTAFLCDRIKRVRGTHTELEDIFLSYDADGGKLKPAQFVDGLTAICSAANITIRRDGGRAPFLYDVAFVEPKKALAA